MRPDGSPSRLRDALAAGKHDVALYVAAGVVYVALGVAFPELLFSWVVAVGFLLLVVSIPALVRMLTR